MTNVGIIGLGMMGQTHLDIYGAHPDANILAISDVDPDRLSGKTKAAGNIEGQAQGGVDLSEVRKYTEGMELIADDEVELVDICLPTPLHRRFAEAAFDAGKHAMVEKPLGRTGEDAAAIADAADKASTLSMAGMCMRFWPAWVWLKQAIDHKPYGDLQSLHLRRLTSNPGGPFYTDGKQNGGAILDLHVHDTDFVHWCFGPPAKVYSRGYSTVTGEIDHVHTTYVYNTGGDENHPVVTAEGGWAMAEGFGFEMRFTANFAHATVAFNVADENELQVVEPGGSWTPIQIDPGLGYEHELGYLLDCIKQNRKPQTVTLRDAAVSVAIVDSERRSIHENALIDVPGQSRR